MTITKRWVSFIPVIVNVTMLDIPHFLMQMKVKKSVFSAFWYHNHQSSTFNAEKLCHKFRTDFLYVTTPVYDWCFTHVLLLFAPFDWSQFLTPAIHKSQCCKKRYFRGVEQICHVNTFLLFATIYIASYMVSTICS